MSKNIQLKLIELKSAENGFDVNEKGDNIIALQLINPAIGIETQHNVKSTRLKDRQTIKIKHLEDSMIYKNKLEGETELIISISKKEKKGRTMSILKKVAGITASTFLAGVTGGLVTTVLVGIGNKVSEELFSDTEDDDKLDTIAIGRMSINENTPAGESVVVCKLISSIKIKVTGQRNPIKLAKGFKSL